MQQEHDDCWDEGSRWDWVIGLLLAVPMVALYIYVDQHPRWWAVLGVRALFGLIAAVPMVAGAMAWADDDLRDDDLRDDDTLDRRLAFQAVGHVALATWLAVILPVLFTPPPVTGLPPRVDAALRGSWLVLCVAAGVAVVCMPRAPEWWRNLARRVFAVLAVGAGAWPYSVGETRLLGGAVLLACLGGLALLGVWSRPPRE